MWKRFAAALAPVMVSATVLLEHDLFLKLETYFVPPETAVRAAVPNGTFAKSEAAMAVKHAPMMHDRLVVLSPAAVAGRTGAGE
jgi:hypothetical protein